MDQGADRQRALTQNDSEVLARPCPQGAAGKFRDRAMPARRSSKERSGLSVRGPERDSRSGEEAEAPEWLMVANH